MRTVLSRRDFRLLWGADITALTGEFMQLVVLSGIALSLAARASAWGWVLLAQAVPQALLMPLGGAAADRWGARRVLIAADLIVLCDLIWLGSRPSVTLGGLYIFAAVYGACSALVQPAINAIVPDLLPEHEVQAGNALMSVATTVAQLAGPALAVAFLAAGRTDAFAAMAALWGAATVLLLLLPPAAAATPRAGGTWEQLSAGLRAARADPVISTLVLAGAIFACGYGGAVYVGLPALARLSFGTGNGGVGVLYGANGAGLLLGGLAAGALARGRRRGLVGGIAILGSGLWLIAGSAAGRVWLAAPLVLLSGLCWSVGLVMTVTAVQKRSPADVRGRVLALLTMGFFGLYPLSYLLAGLVGDALGPRGILACGGGLMAAAGAFALTRRDVREVVL